MVNIGWKFGLMTLLKKGLFPSLPPEAKDTFCPRCPNEAKGRSAAAPAAPGVPKPLHVALDSSKILKLNSKFACLQKIDRLHQKIMIYLKQKYF